MASLKQDPLDKTLSDKSVPASTSEDKSVQLQVNVRLDNEGIPRQIEWASTDTGATFHEAASMHIAFWDKKAQAASWLHLRQKDLPQDDLKWFCINTLEAISKELRQATEDNYMAEEIHKLCQNLANYCQEKSQANDS